MTPNLSLLTVSRPLWLRLWQALVEAADRARELFRDAHEHARSRRIRELERSAVGHLSPHLLRDIGASAEVLAESQRRDALRAMRLDLNRL